MFGARIKEYISQKGLKLGAVANKAGIPLNTFSAMVNGKRKITVEEYVRICAALGVPFEQFIPQTA